MPVKETAAEQQAALRLAEELSSFENYDDRADDPALLEKHGWKHTKDAAHYSLIADMTKAKRKSLSGEDDRLVWRNMRKKQENFLDFPVVKQRTSLLVKKFQEIKEKLCFAD